MLMDMVQLKFLGLDGDLLGCSDDFSLSLKSELVSTLVFGWVCGGEQNPLNFVSLFSIFDIFTVGNCFQFGEVLLIGEEDIGFVHNDGFEPLEIKWFSSFEGSAHFTMS